MKACGSRQQCARRESSRQTIRLEAGVPALPGRESRSRSQRRWRLREPNRQIRETAQPMSDKVLWRRCRWRSLPAPGTRLLPGNTGIAAAALRVAADLRWRHASSDRTNPLPDNVGTLWALGVHDPEARRKNCLRRRCSAGATRRSRQARSGRSCWPGGKWPNTPTQSDESQTCALPNRSPSGFLTKYTARASRSSSSRLCEAGAVVSCATASPHEIARG